MMLIILGTPRPLNCLDSWSHACNYGTDVRGDDVTERLFKRHPSFRKKETGGEEVETGFGRRRDAGSGGGRARHGKPAQNTQGGRPTRSGKFLGPMWEAKAIKKV